MVEPYSFAGKESNVQSIIHAINLSQKHDIIGVELGTWWAQSSLTIAQNCPNLKTIYTIDSFKPHSDYLKFDYDGNPFSIWDEKVSEHCKLIANHNIKFSGVSEKVVLLEKEIKDSLNSFDDDSLDFIFMDCYTTPEQYLMGMHDWYPKIKKGGLFSGHDYRYNVIQNVVSIFRQDNKIDNTMSCFDNVWCWIK